VIKRRKKIKNLQTSPPIPQIWIFKNS